MDFLDFLNSGPPLEKMHLAVPQDFTTWTSFGGREANAGLGHRNADKGGHFPRENVLHSLSQGDTVVFEPFLV